MKSIRNKNGNSTWGIIRSSTRKRIRSKNRNRIRNRCIGTGQVEADAYFTVEAAVIIPVVLGIFVMIMYLSFYLYDRCVLAQDCYVLSYRQSIEKGGADRAGASAAGEQLNGKLFMLSSLRTGCSSGGTVRVNADAGMHPPLIALDNAGVGQEWGLHVEEKSKHTDPPREYRRVRRLLKIAGAAAGRD